MEGLCRIGLAKAGEAKYCGGCTQHAGMGGP